MRRLLPTVTVMLLVVACGSVPAAPARPSSATPTAPPATRERTPSPTAAAPLTPAPTATPSPTLDPTDPMAYTPAAFAVGCETVTSNTVGATTQTRCWGPSADGEPSGGTLTWIRFNDEAAAQYVYGLKVDIYGAGCTGRRLDSRWKVVSTKMGGRQGGCEDFGTLVFTIDGLPVVGEFEPTGYETDLALAVAWFKANRPFPATKGMVAATIPPVKPYVGQKTFTISGGRTTGISKRFKLRGGTYKMRWTARGGDTGSCFGSAWLNTPGGSDVDPEAEIYDLYADTSRTRKGTEEVYVDRGSYVVGTITTCRWTVTFVNTGPADGD